MSIAPNLEADVDRQEKAQGMGPGALVKYDQFLVQSVYDH